jgi:hypothetical protein
VNGWRRAGHDDDKTPVAVAKFYRTAVPLRRPSTSFARQVKTSVAGTSPAMTTKSASRHHGILPDSRGTGPTMTLIGSRVTDSDSWHNLVQALTNEGWDGDTTRLHSQFWAVEINGPRH